MSLVVALALLAMLGWSLASATAAHADSRVTAFWGQVSFFGDGNSHRLTVQDSTYDLARRQWRLDDASALAAARQTASEWLGLQRKIDRVDDNPDDPDSTALLNGASLTVAQVLRLPQLPESVKPTLQTLQSLLDDYAAEHQKLQLLKDTVESRLVQISEAAIGGADPSDSLAARQVLEQTFRNEIERVEQRLADLERSIDAMRKVFDRIAAGLPSGPAKRVRNAVKSLMRKAQNLRNGGFATVGFLGRLATIAVVASAVVMAAEISSDHTVVIVDETGNPIRAQLPCRNLVRSTGGARVPNAVSCPAPHLPDQFGAHGFDSLLGLYIEGGAGRDLVNLRLRKSDTPFTTAYIDAGAGDDMVGGSSLDERIIGGPGNDVIFGKGGDDQLFGDNLYSNASVSATNANDQLFGGSGSDTIKGELGDDLIFGGDGDDDAWIGSALNGGPGNDVVVGGQGSDEMNGGSGRDTILAKESDFPGAGGGRAPDEFDPEVDCGADQGVTQYVTRSSIADADGDVEEDFSCGSVLSSVPSADSLIRSHAAGSRWPWFG